MNFLYLDEDLAVAGSYSRRKKEEGRREKENAIRSMVSAIKNVLITEKGAIKDLSMYGVDHALSQLAQLSPRLK
jgi:hypothetical protein